MTEQDFHILAGRINAIHAALSCIARALPPDIAKIAESNLKTASLKIEADMTALPIPDASIAEALRVMNEQIHVLSCAAQTTTHQI